MTHLSLSFLGSFLVALDGQPVSGFESKQVRALLPFLAVQPDQPHSRESLAGLLWPDLPDRTARSNLRYALSNLRKVIHDREADPPFLLITRESLRFNLASDYDLDVRTLAQQLAHRRESSTPASLESACALYRGPFLQGFSSESAALEEWILFKREEIERSVRDALDRLAMMYEQRGDYDRAAASARRLLEIEPWDEHAHQQLIRALASRGEHNAALAQYEICRRLLRQELGIEPSKQTMLLYESIRDRTFEKEIGFMAPSFSHAARVIETECSVFVARERELAQLNGCLDLALAGQGRAIFVTGDAGSGKTALLQEFADRAMQANADLIVAQGNGNAHTGIGDPYLPFIEAVQMLTGDVQARWAGGTITREHAQRLWNLLPSAVLALLELAPDLIDRFVGAPSLVQRARASAQASAAWLTRLEALTEHRTATSLGQAPPQVDLFEQYTRVLQTLAQQHPLILLLDDLQWADAASISLLFHLGRRLPGSRILIAGAFRPADLTLGSGGDRHPLLPVVNEFQREWGNVQIDLAQAEGKPFVDALLDTGPNRLSSIFRETLYRHTEGHALFTIELLRGLQQRGDLVKDETGRWVEGPALNWDKLPARVEAVIAERVTRLPEEWQALLATASVEGEEFTAEVIARVRNADPSKILDQFSGPMSKEHRLVRAQSLERFGDQRLCHYRFCHHLFQKYLYATLDSVQKSHLHEAIGIALEDLYRDQTERVALQLARHFERARLLPRAVKYLKQAGERATRLAADADAIAHFSHGLELLQTLPETPERDEQELALQLGLAVSLETNQVFSSERVRRAYDRAYDLCQRIAALPQLFQTRFGLHNYYSVRAEYEKSLALAEQMLSTADQTGDPIQRALGCWQKAYDLLMGGEFLQARTLFEQVIDFYDPQEHRSLLFLLGMDMGVVCRAWLSWTLWSLGFPDQSLARAREAIDLARKLNHPFNLSMALCMAGGYLHIYRGEYRIAAERAEEVIHLGAQAAFWPLHATLVQGRSKIEQGQVEEGIAQLEQALPVMDEQMRATTGRSQRLGWLARAYTRAGQFDQASSSLDTAFAFMNNTGECFSEAELHNNRGELLWAQGDAAHAEASFNRAVEVARAQAAKSWELRATLGLARLWQAQGRRREACERLGVIFGWFKEGFDTPDLREARMVLGDST